MATSDMVIATSRIGAPEVGNRPVCGKSAEGGVAPRTPGTRAEPAALATAATAASSDLEPRCPGRSGIGRGRATSQHLVSRLGCADLGDPSIGTSKTRGIDGSRRNRRTVERNCGIARRRQLALRIDGEGWYLGCRTPRLCGNAGGGNAEGGATQGQAGPSRIGIGSGKLLKH